MKALWLVLLLMVASVVASATSYTRSISESVTLTAQPASPAVTTASILEINNSSDTVSTVHNGPGGGKALNEPLQVAGTTTAIDNRQRSGTPDTLTVVGALAPVDTRPGTGGTDGLLIADAIGLLLVHHGTNNVPSVIWIQ